MYTLLTEFRDGDNVVTTMMEHNSNFVPWYALCREILPRFGRRVECRVARFDHATGRARPRPPRRAGRRADQAGLLSPARRTSSAPSRRWRSSGAIAGPSGYRTPRRRQRLAAARRRRPARAQQRVDVQALGRRLPGLLVPQDAGAVRRRRPLRQGAPARARPAVPLRRRHDRRGRRSRRTTSTYNDLPWKYAAGTPNILGVIASAQALRLLVDLVGPDGAPRWFDNDAAAAALPSSSQAMGRVGGHTRALTELALQEP